MNWETDHWVFDEVTADEFAVSLGYDPENLPDDSTGQRLASVLGAAVAVLQDALQSCSPTKPMSADLYKQCALEVAGEWWRRNDQGTAQNAGFEGTVAVRAPRNPLTTIFPVLRVYCGGGFA